jgi:hypothetical protein
MHHEWLTGFDAVDGKSRAKLLPALHCEGAGVTHPFATAIRSTRAKPDVEFELLAFASDVVDAQCVILVGMSFGASVPSKQVDPSSTDAGL